MKRTKEYLKTTAASFLAVFVFFFLLEGSARLYMVAKTSITLSPKVVFKPDLSYLKYGFEYLFPLKERSPDGKEENCKYVIKTYGGSTTWGWGVKRDESYPSQLGAILREDFHTDKIAVHNQGICYGTSYKALESILSGLRSDIPDRNRKTIFIVYSGINDALKMYSASHGTIKIQDELEFNKFELTPRQRLYFLVKKTALFFSLADDFYHLEVKPMTHKLSESDVSWNEFARKLLARYENNLISIINICRVYNIKLVFGKEALNEETIYSVDKILYLRYYNMVFDRMEKVAKENNIPFVDADAYFKSLPGSKRYFIYSAKDWGHLTAEGNRLLAELFAKAIIENKFI